RVIIRPFLGGLTRAKGAIPHPRGEIAVSLALAGGRLEAEIGLPEGVDGDLVWGGARRALPSGHSRFSLPAPPLPPPASHCLRRYGRVFMTASGGGVRP